MKRSGTEGDSSDADSRGGSISRNVAGDHGGGFYATGTIASSSLVKLSNLTIGSNQSSLEDTGAAQNPGTPDASGVETVTVTLSPALLAESTLFVRLQAWE